MRHREAGSKLKRDAGSRKSLLRNLVTSVIVRRARHNHGPKAKAVKPLVDKMITLGKRGHAACAAAGRLVPGDSRNR